MEQSSKRARKTDIVRKRTGCQNCRTKRRKCDETRPECLACSQRGVKCSGYQRSITFKDVSELTAESSKKFEAARWSALQLEDERRKQKPTHGATRRSTRSPRDESEGAIHVDTQQPYAATPVSPPMWSGLTGNDTDNSVLPWDLFEPSFQLLDDDGLQSALPNAEASFDNVEQVQHRQPHPVQSSSPLVTRNSPKSNTLPGGQLPIPLADSNSADKLATPTNNDTMIMVEGNISTQIPNTWDEFLNIEGPLDGSSPSTQSSLGDPATDCQLSFPVEEALVRHFEAHVIPVVPVTLGFPSLFRDSSCFRAAVLALSAGNFKITQHNSADSQALSRKTEGNLDWKYYEAAVKKLNHELQKPGNRRDEHVAGAALLLAYHEIEVGSPLGIRNHASGLDAIASKVDFSSSSTSALFKAWRMLRYDVKFQILGTRKSSLVTDLYEPCSFLDPQLAIRDILSSLWRLHSRHAMEATFNTQSQPGRPSASEMAGQWLRTVLNRQCDHRQFQQRDYHTESLTPEMMLDQCDNFTKRLDQWHRSLCDHDLPIANLGTDQDFVTGPSFETIVTYRFSDDRKAVDYIMYLISRMACNYIRSLFNPAILASVSEAWGKIIVGIVCGMEISRQRFTLLPVEALLHMTALLCESTNICTTIIDVLIPRVMRTGIFGPELVGWTYLKRGLELVVKERLRGRSIRLIMDGSDEHHKHMQVETTQVLVAFGDYNGKGHFRECYSFDWSHDGINNAMIR
ncbi:hypothetical protein BGZ61DRAFT_432079 [Ilyonectria robusta]|uniref:uncharacterized protein n=1 Tax=Ilyonectria robusta TaxID=1079257 RepID=UPI001E8DB6AD|nr:uncharacterized protein BGZ61DRAFT_432079 [Ilyonectria robusta]KAH8663342.1 hypothetical protein BGZ61DRAFT_432079 [Ilyonectria robusta]